MSRSSLYFLILMLPFFTVKAQQSCFTNPSLEGPPVSSAIPAPWQWCFGFPDTQPGQWGITQLPSNGTSYVSFLHDGISPTGYTEGMSQIVTPAFTTNIFYVDIIF